MASLPQAEPEGAAARPDKIPESVLVVIHSTDLQVLLLERADHPGFWQSVTGSLDFHAEPLIQTATRELFEETGIVADGDRIRLRDWALANVYEIYPVWRHRYAPGVTHNTEHVFSVCVPRDIPVILSPRRIVALHAFVLVGDREPARSSTKADNYRGRPRSFASLGMTGHCAAEADG